MTRRPTRSPARRPTYFRWLIALMGLMVLYHGAAVVSALGISVERGLPVSVLPLFEAAAHTLWALGFAAITLALVKKRPNALRYCGWMLLGFMLYGLIHRAVFARADYDRQRLPFLIAVFVIILAGYLVIEFVYSRVRAPN